MIIKLLFKCFLLLHTLQLCWGSCVFPADGQRAGKLWRSELSVNDVHSSCSRGILHRGLAHFIKQAPPPRNTPPHVWSWRFSPIHDQQSDVVMTEVHMTTIRSKTCDVKTTLLKLSQSFVSLYFHNLQMFRIGQWDRFPPDGSSSVSMTTHSSICHTRLFVVHWPKLRESVWESELSLLLTHTPHT